MYLTIFPSAIEIKKRSADDRDESVARPRYIPPPPPTPEGPSSSSWEEEGSVDGGPKSWDAPVDGLLSYVLTGKTRAKECALGCVEAPQWIDAGFMRPNAYF